jgi:hypothetical protein
MRDSRPIAVHVCVLLAFCLISAGAWSKSNTFWFQEHVTWKAGAEPRRWETDVTSPNEKQHYRLTLIPLWCMEGGIVGMEFHVARPDAPDHNLLGDRTEAEQPFVITVEDLQRGIDRSRFGAVRSFRLGTTKFRLAIEGSRLGPQACCSETCIQELTVQISVGGR